MRLFIAVMVLSLAVTGAAAEGDRAAGDLEIARKGQALIARLTLPADQVVGFSHRPESDEEKIAVTEALTGAVATLAPRPKRRGHHLHPAGLRWRGSAKPPMCWCRRRKPAAR